MGLSNSVDPTKGPTNKGPTKGSTQSSTRDSNIKDSTIIIEGQTKEGQKFRPSDWAERMSGVLSTFGKDHRIHYSSQLQPLSINGVKCIALNASLKDEHPELFNHLMDFAEMNKLNVISGTDIIQRTNAA